jgi:malate dehydrogenase (oxaloacetate-decarboxylating)
VAAAGIHPAQTLPVSLDVGTDNQELLRDDLYIGWRHPRLRGEAYDAFVDEFVRAVKLRFPKALLQWEDFAPQNASRLLERYRGELPSFNDVVQGGAAVAVAALLAASRAAGRELAEERLLVVGSGAEAAAIAGLFPQALCAGGLDAEASRAAVDLLDPAGLAGSPLVDAVRAARPTALVGVSGRAGLFDEPVVRTMASQVERPAVLLLSTPADSSEARPADVLAWTDGRALVAAGAPFDPVEWAGPTVRVSLCNNAFVFPGVGLGVLVCEAREVTDGMFAAAARALAAFRDREDVAAGGLFPPVTRLRAVSACVAEAVVRQAVGEGVARNPPPDPAETVAAAMWGPAYPAIDVV